ncbi:hypothetical protein IFR05_007736 [Cadophora sp. M221]|nr:hypothetical protein IFR05_007736 [Cadophora sp. M221]
MTDHSPLNSRPDGKDGYQNLQEDSSCQDQVLSPGQDLPDEFQSCSESFTPRNSLEQNQAQEIENENRVSLETSLKVTIDEDSADETTVPKQQKAIEPIYVGGLEAIREVESHSARSPSLASPSMPIHTPVPKNTKAQGLTSLLGRFGRDVLLCRNYEGEMNELRVDEDGNYYVYGDEGFRVKLKEG